MSTKIVKRLSSLLIVAVLALGLVAFSQTGTVSAANLDKRGVPGGRGVYGQSTSTVIPGSRVTLTPLSDAEINALNQAILEEYGALNLYESVIDQLGNVYPFSMIVNAEQQHVNALVRQATKYGVAVPPNPGLATEISFSSLSAACQAGVAAEIADAALYDNLKLTVVHSDILQVFTNLQNASLYNHLPAFQACQ